MYIYIYIGSTQTSILYSSWFDTNPQSDLVTTNTVIK